MLVKQKLYCVKLCLVSKIPMTCSALGVDLTEVTVDKEKTYRNAGVKRYMCFDGAALEAVQKLSKFPI